MTDPNKQLGRSRPMLPIRIAQVALGLTIGTLGAYELIDNDLQISNVPQAVVNDVMHPLQTFDVLIADAKLVISPEE